MGSLIGHVLPGSFFILFGLWWAFAIFHKYFYAIKESQKEESLTKRRKMHFKYRNTASFPCAMCYKLPVDGVIKIVVIAMGIGLEFVAFFIDDAASFYNKMQHITMYSFFLINGVMDILTASGHVLIPNLDYVTGFLAFLVEGILLMLHIDGTMPMEARLHTLLVLLTLASAISTILEISFRKSVFGALGRAYFVLLQGTWFYQIGFVLYVYDWKDGTSTQMKMVAYIFGWHLAAVFVFLLLLGYLIRWKVFAHDNQLPYDILYPENSNSKKLYSKLDIKLEELSSSEDL